MKLLVEEIVRHARSFEYRSICTSPSFTFLFNLISFQFAFVSHIIRFITLCIFAALAEHKTHTPLFLT
jgi:hypothetical protein